MSEQDREPVVGDAAPAVPVDIGTDGADAAQAKASSSPASDVEESDVHPRPKSVEEEEASPSFRPSGGQDPAEGASSEASAGAGGFSTGDASKQAGEGAKPGDPVGELRQPMGYHDALHHVSRVNARRDHVDMDERITDYMRSGDRSALDTPSRRGNKRRREYEKHDRSDPVMVEAKALVARKDLSTKDVANQVLIDQMKSRIDKDRKPIGTLSKGPANAKPLDPAVVAAAAAARTGGRGT